MSISLPLFGFIVTTSGCLVVWSSGSLWGVNWWLGPAPFLLSIFLIALSLAAFFNGTILQQEMMRKKMIIGFLSLISHYWRTLTLRPWDVTIFETKSPVARITALGIQLDTSHNNIIRITSGRHSFHAFIRIVAPFATFIEKNIFRIE